MNTLNANSIATIRQIAPDEKEEASYYVGESYQINYEVKKKVPNKINFILKTDCTGEIELESNSEAEVTIVFKPISAGQKSFKLLVTAHTKSEVLLDEIFQVQTKLIEIAAQVHKQLPSIMKLGQTAGVIFLFTNKGHQPITGVNIEVN